MARVARRKEWHGLTRNCWFCLSGARGGSAQGHASPPGNAGRVVGLLRRRRRGSVGGGGTRSTGAVGAAGGDTGGGDASPLRFIPSPRACVGWGAHPGGGERGGGVREHRVNEEGYGGDDVRCSLPGHWLPVALGLQSSSTCNVAAVQGKVADIAGRATPAGP